MSKRGVSAAGAAVRDITPPIGIELVGYHRPFPSNSILDPLMATAFALESDDAGAILVSVDNAGMLVAHTSEIRQRIADHLGLSTASVMVCFSHTHSGPETLDGKPEWVAYRRSLSDRVVAAAREAWRSRRRCRLGWGVTRASIGVNSRELGPDGKARMGVNPDGPLDDRVGVLRIDDAESGSLLGIVIVCTAHANVLRGDSAVISGDYIGWTRSLLSEDLNCPVGFVIGSAGNVNPLHRGSISDLDTTARILRGAVLPVLGQIKPREISVLWSQSSVLNMRLTRLPCYEEAVKKAAIAAKEWGVDTTPWLQAVIDLLARGIYDLEMDLEVQLMRINDGFIAGIPMEPFTEIAIEVARRVGSDTAFFCGYVNGYLGYLPTEQEYHRGGYQVERNPVVYGPEVGGFLMPPVPETADHVVEKVLWLAKRSQPG